MSFLYRSLLSFRRLVSKFESCKFVIFEFFVKVISKLWQQINALNLYLQANVFIIFILIVIFLLLFFHCWLCIASFFNLAIFSISHFFLRRTCCVVVSATLFPFVSLGMRRTFSFSPSDDDDYCSVSSPWSRLKKAGTLTRSVIVQTSQNEVLSDM